MERERDRVFDSPVCRAPRIHSSANRDAHFVIEASWMTGHVWHGRGNKGKAHSASLGYDVGRNHEVGRKIAEILDWNISTTPYSLL